MPWKSKKPENHLLKEFDSFLLLQSPLSLIHPDACRVEKQERWLPERPSNLYSGESEQCLKDCLNDQIRLC